MQKSTCVIFNPNAGRLSNVAGVPVSKNLLAHTLHQMKVEGWRILYKQTQKPNDTFLFAKQAAEDGFENIIVVGGDGTMGFASQALMGTETSLGTLPAGSSNVWAQQLNMQGLKLSNLTALDKGMHKMINADRKKMDMGTVNETPFLFWTSFGLDARIVHAIENNRAHRQFTELHYTAEALRIIQDWQGVNLDLEVDGKLLSGKFTLAVITNIRRYVGGLIELSPEAVFDDGEMDLWLIDYADIPTMLRYISAFILGNPKNIPEIKKIPFSTLKIYSNEPLYYQMDGEPYEQESFFDIKVLKRSISVLIPKGTDQDFFQNIE